MTPYYQREGVTIYCGDCREILPTLGKVDCVVTDPPYGVDFQYDKHCDIRDGYETWCEEWSSLVFDSVSENVLMACGIVNVSMWARIRPFKWIIAWLKPAAMGRSPIGFCNWEPMLLWGKGASGSVDVFTAPIIPDCSIDGHPCPKPIRWGVESVLRMDAQTILDPFMGSGTTGVACVRLGRKFIGIEISQAYCDIAVKRIEAEFAKTALLDSVFKAPEQLELVVD